MYETVTVDCIDCGFEDVIEAATTLEAQETALIDTDSSAETATEVPAEPSSTMPSLSMEFNVTLDDDQQASKTETTDVTEIIKKWFQVVHDMLVPSFRRESEPTATPEVTTAPPISSTTEDHSVLLSLLSALWTPTNNTAASVAEDSGRVLSSSEEDDIPRATNTVETTRTFESSSTPEAI